MVKLGTPAGTLNQYYRDTHAEGANKFEMDNFVDALRGFATKWGPSVSPMSKEERRVKQLPPELQPEEVLSKVGTPAFVELQTAQRNAMHQIEVRERKEAEKDARAWSRVFGGRPVAHRKYRRG